MVSRLPLIMLLFLLSACADVQSDAWVKPILISKHDVLTEQTAKDIAVHNETWEANK